ncbi:VPLPA-CTERM sorting domain-containing protein [Roseobacter sp. MH60115]|uniref:VPLPA-CTERM sorting domain-containing protein n=1 Tax=Roseobacter sp. MH60115 TaxID=2785324 RepID=UPI0018A26BA6|nr:VPLPA-CTERM sorting domain-containing protein [Roseobacter sp. MH60115]
MYNKICAPALALTLFAGAAQAATVGPFTFNDNAFADNASIATTLAGTRGPAVNPAGAADGNLSTASNLNDSFVEIFFTDNVLVNGPGFDIVIFVNSNNNVIRLSTGPDTNSPTRDTGVSFDFISVSAEGNTSGFGIVGGRIDLSDLGFADGAEVTDGLFLSRGGVFTTVWDVAALNSRDVVIDPDPDPDPNVVPLPAGLSLLLGALGVLGVLRRRSE